MSNDRVAVDTIIGYYYQFDYFIWQILEQKNDFDQIIIEGIEDIDVCSSSDNTAIQCKYYSKSEYNHSVIARPIRLMLKHYKETLLEGNSLQYKIYGHFAYGQEKLPTTLDVEFAKSKFFIYKKAGVIHEYHKELQLSDAEINAFLEHLIIEVYACSYEEQEKNIINKMKIVFNCNDFEANYYYYNNALRIVKELSTKQNIIDRTIKKGEFLFKINKKDTLFNLWFLKKKGLKTYCQSIKSQYFSSANISPFERFFLVECDSFTNEIDLKSLLIKISKKWSKLSLRDCNPFCPYVYLHNIPENILVKIKNLLQEDEFTICDGYDYKGADFCKKSICRKANFNNGIKLKIINDLNQIDEVLNVLNNTKEVYQFYIKEPYYFNDNLKHIKIQIEMTDNVSSII